MEKLKPYAFLVLAAILYSLGFPNLVGIYIPFAPIIATVIICFYIFKAETLKLRLFYYFFYNSIINLLSFYWITNTLQEFGNLPFIVAAFMNFCYTFIFNPHYLILIGLLSYIKKEKPRLEEYYFSTGLFSTFLAAFMTALEYFLPQQFPVMLGQPWIVFSEFLGAASIVGLPGFSFFSYLCAFETLRLIKVRKLSTINGLSIIIFIVVNPFLVIMNSSDLQSKAELPKKDINIRIVQANISNFLKTASEQGGYASVKEVITRYEDLSIRKFDQGQQIDLIVWPETAYPYPIYTNSEDITQTAIPDVFHRIIETTGSSLLFGGYDHFRDNEDGSFYKTEHNAALLINNEKQITHAYHKHVLIPFGETLPLGPLNKWASKKLPEMAFFQEGSTFNAFPMKNGISYINTICYEILRPEFLRDYLNSFEKRPDFMINLTNDSWYGNTVEPEQHLFLAKWRAIEFSLPIIRSTNTGISTIVDHRGKELKRLNYEVTGNLDYSLSSRILKQENRITLFQKNGFWGILPLWLLYFIFHAILIKLDHAKNRS